jgi:hypothetical protein
MDQKTEDDDRTPRRLHPKEKSIVIWSELPLPNPAYDPRTGWKLDEFAMHCEPDATREYKQNTFNTHFPHLAKRRQIWAPILILHFPLTVKKRLLEPRFRVTGFRPGAYEPEDIPIPLLERMRPIVEPSELHDLSEKYEVRRRYESVRVFEPGRKAAGGRPTTYDWPGLASKMRAEGIRFRNRADLVRYCQENVLLKDSGKPPPQGSPDDKTVRGAIPTHQLEFFLENG